MEDTSAGHGKPTAPDHNQATGHNLAEGASKRQGINDSGSSSQSTPRAVNNEYFNVEPIHVGPVYQPNMYHFVLMQQ